MPVVERRLSHVYDETRPPEWWSLKGQKMAIGDYNPIEHTLTIESVAAKLIVSAATRPGLWNMSWRIDHGASDASGNIKVGTTELMQCFGLAVGVRASDMTAADQTGYWFHAYVEGAFARLGPYINVPYPAIPRMQGQPCVSLCLTEDIREAVRTLMNNRNSQHS